MDISIIIPCYNETPSVLEETIRQVHQSLTKANLPSYEILVINDGSTKYEYSTREKNTRLIHHEIKKGYGASLKTGLRESKYKWIGITDADGTYPNEDFDKLIQASHNVDMVIGARDRNGIPKLRRFPKWVLRTFASYLSNENIIDLNSGMRIFKKSMALEFYKLYPNGFSFTSTITMAAFTNGYEVKYFPINYRERSGSSHIHPIKDTVRFFSLVTRLSLYFNPLRFFLPLTLVFLVAAVLRGLRDYALQQSFGGLTLILFFMAFQTLFFGLLAEIMSKK